MSLKVNNFLQQFNFQFKYKPGRSHGNADTMSRRPSAENVVTAIHQLDVDPGNIRRTQLVDEQLAPVIKTLEEGKPLPAFQPLDSAEPSSKMDFCIGNFNPPLPP